MRDVLWLCALGACIGCLLGVAGCGYRAGGGASPGGQMGIIAAPDQPSLPQSGLPALPAGRKTRVLSPNHKIEGYAVYEANPESEIMAHGIQFHPGGDGLAYAIYEVVPGPDWIDSIIAIGELESSTISYCLVSNYDAGHWELIEPEYSLSPRVVPVPGQRRIAVADWTPYVSGEGAIYFCVLQQDPVPGDEAYVNYVTWLTPQDRALEFLNDVSDIEAYILAELGDYQPLYQDFLDGSFGELPARPDLLNRPIRGQYYFDAINAVGNSYLGIAAYAGHNGPTGVWRRELDGTTSFHSSPLPPVDLLLIAWLTEVHRAETDYRYAMGRYGDLAELSVQALVDNRAAAGAPWEGATLWVVNPSVDDFTACASADGVTYTVGPDGLVLLVPD